MLNTESYYLQHSYRNWLERYVNSDGNIQYNLRTEWYEEDVPWLAEINRIRANVNNLSQVFLKGKFYDAISYDAFISYSEVNTIEDILLITKNIYDNMRQQLLLCGTFTCGGDLL